MAHSPDRRHQDVRDRRNDRGRDRGYGSRRSPERGEVRYYNPTTNREPTHFENLQRRNERRSDDDYDRHYRGGRYRSRSPRGSRDYRDRDRDYERREDTREVERRLTQGKRPRSPVRHRGNSRDGSNKRPRYEDRDPRATSRNDKHHRRPSPRSSQAPSERRTPGIRGDSPHDRFRPVTRDHEQPHGRAPRPRSRSLASEKRTQASRPSTPPSKEDEEARKFLERQQKVEKWKASLAAKAAANGTANLSNQADAAKDESHNTPVEQYQSTKFDAKAYTKRTGPKKDGPELTLGGNVDIPKTTSAAPEVKQNMRRPVNSTSSGPFIPIPDSRLLLLTSIATAKPTKITGFGLNKVPAEDLDRTSARSAVVVSANLDADADEDNYQRRLEKLPDMPEDLQVDAQAIDKDELDQDEEGDLRSDEDEAQAAREAAQRRAQEMQSVRESTEVVDVSMTDQPQKEDDVDPLDAFMENLEAPQEIDVLTAKNERQVFNSDDEGDLDAVGDGMNDISKMKAKRKKKEVPTTDHSKINYEPFRKQFYSESVELADMTPEDVEALRADLENITIKGKDPPKPILKFSQGGFGAQIVDVIRAQNFEKPTAIQSQALPAIMSGRDTLGIAKTGSGKTVAFILPMFRHIKDQRPLENLEGPIGLILAPTRELATQIHKECKPYVQALGLRAVCAYGGAPIKEQIAELKRGAEIVVCTAGRMIDLLAANSGRVINLKRVTYVVLDEADRMFDMGFEPQISKILDNVRRDRQTVLFSATFPKRMDYLVRKHLRDALVIEVSGRSVVAPEIEQIIEVREENTRFNRLLQLLGDLHAKDNDARSLVFVERQETADSMLKELLKKHHLCVSMHGGRDQIDRDQAISDFKAGHYPTMIATSVAARGLDVKQLELVVNFDPPSHREDYVHQCGRTGRAGNLGTAVTFVTPEQDHVAPFLIKALTDSEREVPESLKELAERHQAKVKSGAALRSGGGYGGRGIDRLDAARDAERKHERKLLKSGDEPDSSDDDEDNKKKKDEKKKIDELMAKAVSNVKESKDVTTQPEPKVAAIPVGPPAPNSISVLNAHLDNAMKVQKAEKPAQTPKGGKVNDRLARAAAAAANISSRLGTQKGRHTSDHHHDCCHSLTHSTGAAARVGAPPTDNRGPDAGAFHATLVINDFPQKARWAVTNRTNVAKILEATGTSITSKGVFYPEGKEPEEGGDPKLYILVEGDTEIVVEDAMRELTRLLREGLQAHLDQEGRAPTEPCRPGDVLSRLKGTEKCKHVGTGIDLDLPEPNMPKIRTSVSHRAVTHRAVIHSSSPSRP
nr:pre-mrna-processing atp-dependent rna helicase prp5 [Quercus suber]